MEQIVLNPYYAQFEPKAAFLIDDTFAITSDGRHSHLVEVKPTQQAGVYRQAEPYNYITVATGGITATAIQRIVDKLKAMDAYTLLTKHYDHEEGFFLVNKKLRGPEGRIKHRR